MLIFTHFSNVDNAGDIYSCPVDYFGKQFENYSKINFVDLKLNNKDNNNLIIGGGGMLHEGFINILEKLINKQYKVILWGIGINEHNLHSQFFPSFINKFDLVGLRDWKNPWEYVPCASCMHEVFNNTTYTSKHKCVIYEHYDNIIPINNFPKRSNRLNKNETIVDIIHFLSKSEIIITNSYHGAYWGLLLKRKVLIFEPFSNRFFGFKSEIIYCDRNNWKEKLNTNIDINSDYLNECRKLNLDFFKKTINTLH
ncbi:MAG: hypothetical protein AABX29_04630 [Nanoarchaeota archaeon]